MDKSDKKFHTSSFSLADRLKSFRYAFRGIVALMKHEHNARIHLFILIVVIITGVLFRISENDWIGLPLMVKPAREGSSIGMSKVTSVEKLAPAYELAARYDDVVIAESFVEGTELTAAILGDEALPLIRLETPREFYDYEAKYFAADTRYICPSGLADATERSVQQKALEAFRLLGCSGWGRVDAMLARDGNAYLLEVNTIPGMTDHSLVPMAARARGISFEQLVVRILETAHVG